MKTQKKHKRKAQYFLIGMIACTLILSGCGANSEEKSRPGSEEKAEQTEQTEQAGKTAEGMAECFIEEADISYTVFLNVTTDDEGKIVSVEDAGTSIPGGKDSLYKKAQSLFDELAGKSAGTIRDVDAVSGATCSSEAILSAVEQALEQ